MKRTGTAVCLLALALLSFQPAAVRAQNTSATDQQTQIDALKARIDELERKLDSQAGQGDNEALKNEVQQIKDTVTDSEGPVQTAISDVNKLKKIKVSGYLVGRYEVYQPVRGSAANNGDNTKIDNRFYLREARVKVTAQPTPNTVFAWQLDGATYDRSQVATKDLYMEYHPWGVGVPAPFFVRFGQQNMPFGYTIERSSSVRETPERPKIFSGTSVSMPSYPSFNGLFPGERDKGVALFSPDGSKVDWGLGLFNGTFTKADAATKSFLVTGGKFEDNNSGKTIMGRARTAITRELNVGVSGFVGSQRVATTDSTPRLSNVQQTRWGTDLQYYMQGASIKGEYVTGKEPFYSQSANAGNNRTISGWYIVGVKNLTLKDQFVAQYDTMKDHASAAQLARDSGLLAKYGNLGTWNLGVIHFLDDATKVKLFYEINKEQKNSLRNNGVRVEVVSVF